MTEDFAVPANVSEYGAWRRQQWLRHGQDLADMATRAEVQAYGQSDERRATQAGQAGLFGHMTPQDRGTAAADRDVTVGSEFGGHQQVERLGGTLDWRQFTDSPVPGMVDRRPKRPGYTRTEHPLANRGRG